MVRRVEIERVPDGTVVDPSSKGHGISDDPDAWVISIRLSDTPNRPWSLAWEEQLEALEGDLPDAQWEFHPDERHVYLVATAEEAESLVRQLDALLRRANERCAELVAEVEQRSAENAAQREQLREEAARLQRLLNDIEQPIRGEANDHPSPFDEEGRMRVQCWYCGEGVQYAGYDPCALILVLNWGDEEAEQEKQFFAHFDCFHKSTGGRDVFMYDD